MIKSNGILGHGGGKWGGGWYSKKIKVKTRETVLYYDMMRSQTHM